MLSFKKYLAEMQQTKRVGIQHLEQMKPTDFVALVSFIKNELGGKIDSGNSSTSVKVDGFGIRFGLNKGGNFFLESSNSGPQFKAGAFSSYTKSKYGEVNQISVAYDRLFVFLKSNKKLMSILQKYNENGIKIVGECLYNPIGDVNGSLIKFVAINYQLAKLGKTATFVLFEALDEHGTKLDEKILKEIHGVTTSDFLFTDAKIKTSGVDLNVEISDVLSFIKKYPNWESIVSSRKNADKDLKDLIKTTLLSYQERMSKKVLSIVNDPKFGEEFEGIVIQLANGTPFKVIHDNFKNRKDQKHRPE